IEDLFELLFWIEIHPEGDIQTSRTGLRHYPICIDEEQLRRRWSAAATTWSTKATATTSGSINEFVTVGADFVIRDRGDKRDCASITQPVTPQSVTSTAKSATATTLVATGLEVINSAIHARVQFRVLALRNARHRDYPLR